MTAKQVEREELAKACVSTPAKLRKRLNESRSMMTAECRAIMKDATIDFAGKRYVSKCGRYELAWQTRNRPDQPVSYENQQTSTGGCHFRSIS